jgi:UDP-2,3-diacylglucosamine hydrolase
MHLTRLKKQVDIMLNNRDNMAMRKTLFISDLHLQVAEPSITAAFLAFFAANQDADAIYILGDLFEAWIGDDDDSPYHRDIIATLKTATSKGLKVYFMHGNRDFLVGKQFLQASGCFFLPDESIVDLYGVKVLLMHGDLLCTHDRQYLTSRKYMRHPLIQKIFLFLPLSIRRKIAAKMRSNSYQHMKSLTSEMMDVAQQEVENKMREHYVAYLIHGHTHRPNIHTFDLNNTVATRIVLAAWHDHGSALVWDETGKKELITFK